jgi:phospholipid/cholesterol/gamma-HCH transport system substrate-binding protein
MYDIKKQLAWSKLKVGIVISVALAALLVTVLFSGDILNIMSPKELIRIDFRDVRGLRRGSPVWFSGLEVGSVKSIDLHPKYGTVVSISVDRDVLGYLKKDSHATIQTMGLLGDKYIELSSGSPEAPALQLREMVTGVTETGALDVIATGAVLLQKMNDVVGQLGTIVEMIGKGEGTVSLLLKDPSLYNNLKDASWRVSEMTAALQSRKSTLGKLMGDDLLYNKLVSATESMETFSYKLNNGQGTLNRLVEDPELYENLAQASGRISSILQKVESGEGTAGALISDEELAQELKGTIRELKEITADIKKNPKKYFKFSIF